MKKNILIFAIASLLFSLAGCDTDDRVKMSKDYPADGDINYGIRQVMQYDDVNINGIDIASKFAFFDTFRLTIHYTDSKISGVTFLMETYLFLHITLKFRKAESIAI